VPDADDRDVVADYDRGDFAPSHDTQVPSVSVSGHELARFRRLQQPKSSNSSPRDESARCRGSRLRLWKARTSLVSWLWEPADDFAVVDTVGLRLCTRDEARSVLRLDRLAYTRRRGQLDVLDVVPACALDGDDEPLNEAHDRTKAATSKLRPRAGGPGHPTLA
jgi:hypothetical protein